MSVANAVLPQALRELVETQAADSGFASAEEFLRVLVHDAQHQKSLSEWEAFLLEGLDQTAAEQMAPAQWESYRSHYRSQRLAELRAQLAVGIQELERGEGIPAQEVFDRLRTRNRHALSVRMR